MTEDLQRANEETRRAWNQNAAFWDERMGEGNHFVEVLIWPATERLLELRPGERVRIGGLLRMPAGDRYLIVNPFFHMFGYKAGWLACLLRGATMLPHAVFDVAAILERIETELRAPSVQAALRLAVVQMALTISRLNGYPGRVASVRIGGGHVRGSSSRQWRERNVWLAFEEGVKVARDFVQALYAIRQGLTAAVWLP